MTQMLHNPGLWNSMVIIGLLVLLGDAAWRSWTLEGRVDDPARLFPRSAPARLAFAFGPLEPARTGDGYRGRPVVVTIDPVHAGATEEWSPAGEVAAAGQSIEDWWSERLQAYDDALRAIDSDLRDSDGGRWHPPLAADEARRLATTDDELERFIGGSQRLHAYRELRVGSTGEFTAREHMQLEALLGAE
jgi:hypothetical protein